MIILVNQKAASDSNRQNDPLNKTQMTKKKINIPIFNTPLLSIRILKISLPLSQFFYYKIKFHLMSDYILKN